MDNAKSKSTIDKERGLIGNKKDIFVPEGQGNFTQNNQTIFVGTTKELHDLLEKGDAEDNEVIDMENESNDKSNNKNT